MLRIQNLTNFQLAIPPALTLQPNETRDCYAVSGDFLDRLIQDGKVKILLDTYALMSDTIMDNLGVAFSPSACAMVRTFSGANIATETLTDLAGVVRVKTYGSYTAGGIAGTESRWIKQ